MTPARGGERPRVAVVGAGISGLVAARLLSDAGMRVTVFERALRQGGRIRSIQLGDAVLDGGASHIWSFYRRTRGWLRRLDLASDLVPVGGPDEPLGVGAGDLPGIARCALDVARWWGRLELSRPYRTASLDDRSIADYANSRLRAGFVGRTLRPAFELNAFCPLEEMSRVLLLQAGRLFIGARPKRLRGGLERLPTALGQGLEVILGPEGEVERISQESSGVRLERRLGPELEFEAALVACPPLEAAGMIADLPPFASSFLGEIRHSSLTRAWWQLAPSDTDPEWLVEQRPGPPRLLLAGVRGESMRLSFAAYGKGVREWEEGPEAAKRLRRAAAELWPRFASRTLRAEARLSWERAVTIFAPGHFRALARLGPAPRWGRVALCGDYLVSPTIEGAVISAERAVEGLLALPILGRVRSCLK